MSYTYERNSFRSNIEHKRQHNWLLISDEQSPHPQSPDKDFSTLYFYAHALRDEFKVLCGSTLQYQGCDFEKALKMMSLLKSGLSPKGEVNAS